MSSIFRNILILKAYILLVKIMCSIDDSDENFTKEYEDTICMRLFNNNNYNDINIDIEMKKNTNKKKLIYYGKYMFMFVILY